MTDRPPPSSPTAFFTVATASCVRSRGAAWPRCGRASTRSSPARSRSRSCTATSPVTARFVERFRREAVAAARLAHPNVVTTYDAATDDDEAFIVMELVRGRSVRRVLSDDGPLPVPSEPSRSASQVATRSAHAHAHGLVHRDIKPANILLCEDPDGSVRRRSPTSASPRR